LNALRSMKSDYLVLRYISYETSYYVNYRARRNRGIVGTKADVKTAIKEKVIVDI
jgi:hypothetical protein